MKVGQYVFGVLAIVVGALGIAGLVTTYCVVTLSDKVLLPGEVQIALETLFSSGLGIAAVMASFIMMAIPLLVLVVGGASLLAKRNMFTVSKVVALIVVWIIALVVAFTASALQVEQVFQNSMQLDILLSTTMTGKW